MITTYKKVGEYEIEVVETQPEEIIPEKTLPSKVYEYGFLLKQRIDIRSQWNKQLIQKQKEVDEINAKCGKEMAFVESLIAEADKLGITENPKQITIEEVI